MFEKEDCKLLIEYCDKNDFLVFLIQKIERLECEVRELQDYQESCDRQLEKIKSICPKWH